MNWLLWIFFCFFFSFFFFQFFLVTARVVNNVACSICYSVLLSLLKIFDGIKKRRRFSIRLCFLLHLFRQWMGQHIVRETRALEREFYNCGSVGFIRIHSLHYLETKRNNIGVWFTVSWNMVWTPAQLNIFVNFKWCLSHFQLQCINKVEGWLVKR